MQSYPKKEEEPCHNQNKKPPISDFALMMIIVGAMTVTVVFGVIVSQIIAKVLR